MRIFSAVFLLALAFHSAASAQSLRNVSVEVRSVDISKSALKDIGVSWDVVIGRPTYPVFGHPSRDFNISADLRAIDRKKSVKSHSTARLLTLDGRPATLFVGESTPFNVITYSAFGYSQTVQFVDFGIGITVLPEILDDSRVKLNLKFRTVTMDAPAISPGPGSVYPYFKTRTHESSVIVDSGQTLAVGQFYSEDERRHLSAVPGISRVPILGELFKRRVKEKDETEFVLFVTPRIQ